MARNNDELDRARDELFSHIHRCNVLGSTPEQQKEWMADTVGYLGERFTGLSQAELDELRDMGTRFCQPVIQHGAENTALSPDEVSPASAPEEAIAPEIAAEEATAA